MAIKKDERAELAVSLVAQGDVTNSAVKTICTELGIPVGLSASTTDDATAKKNAIAFYFPDFTELEEQDVIRLIEAYVDKAGTAGDNGETWVAALAKSVTENHKTKYANTARTSLTETAPGIKKTREAMAAVIADDDEIAFTLLAMLRKKGLDFGLLLGSNSVTQAQVDLFNKQNPAKQTPAK